MTSTTVSPSLLTNRARTIREPCCRGHLDVTGGATCTGSGACGKGRAHHTACPAKGATSMEVARQLRGNTGRPTGPAMATIWLDPDPDWLTSSVMMDWVRITRAEAIALARTEGDVQGWP